MRKQGFTTHFAWACVSAICLVGGFALAPTRSWLIPDYVPQRRRPLSIRWCPRPQNQLEMCFMRKDGEVLMNINVDAKTGRPSCLTVYGADGAPTICSPFHRNGVPSEVILLKSYELKHSWGFHDNGGIQYTSEISESGPRHSKEVRQYYDRSGKPTEKRTYVGHCGS